MFSIASLCFIVAILLVTLWLYTIMHPKRKYMTKRLANIQGPLSLPLIGTTYRLFLNRQKDFFQVLDATAREYWPIYKTWVGKYPEIHFSEAEHIEVILRSSVNINKGFIYDFVKDWLGSGLLTSTGKKWHTHRKMLTPAFHFKILENFQEVFAEKSQILVEKLEKEVGNERGFDVYPYITRCALDIICETAMGTQINAQDNVRSSYVDAIYDISELVVSRFISPWKHPNIVYFMTKEGKRFQECVDTLHRFTNKVIRERRISQNSGKKYEEDDIGRKRRLAFLDLLLESTELTDEDIREEVDTFMFEGHDTTATNLCWALFLLGNYPEVQEKVFEEQEAIFGDSDRPPTMEDLANMKYLECTVKDTLRLYPSVPIIMRKVTEELQFGEFSVPENCSVVIHIYNAHRNPKYFPNPEEFNPDNFLPERAQTRHPYAFVPFSAGPRNCIGQKFALLEEKTLLSAIVRRFRIRSLERPSDVRLMGELILRPANGIRLVLERRAPAP